MIGDGQWRALEEVLERVQSLRVLYVCSDTPFVDNAIQDALYKITQPESTAERTFSSCDLPRRPTATARALSRLCPRTVNVCGRGGV